MKEVVKPYFYSINNKEFQIYKTSQLKEIKSKNTLGVSILTTKGINILLYNNIILQPIKTCFDVVFSSSNYFKSFTEFISLSNYIIVSAYVYNKNPL